MVRMKLKRRSLETPISDLCFGDHKMAFLSGPRQCGKTTLGQELLRKRKAGAYKNWDEVTFRREWTHDPRGVVPGSTGRIPLLVLDEIHKARSWKRSLKGLYDTLEDPVDILVTGSARLTVYRRGSDSLLGRYFHFRLHPFSLGELESATIPHPDDVIETLFCGPPRRRRAAQETLETFMKFGTFPEPFLAQDERKARLWRSHRVERVIREDLRDLSRIPDLSRIEMLASLLPLRVGSLLSVASLREELEVSHDTAKRWLQMLTELYYAFEIKPYSKRIARSLRKSGKLYLWDCSEVPGEAARFENLVASHLLKTCHLWTDTGEGNFELCFLRNKQKEEIDFLIVRDGKPWLPIEVKLQDTTPSPNWKRFLPQIRCTRALQLVIGKGVWTLREDQGAQLIVASAADVLRHFA